MKQRHQIVFVQQFLIQLLFAAMLVALYMVFLWAPTERTMGDVQRIFYFHVASAWSAFLAFLAVFVASIGFLTTRRRGWDQVALACAELGWTFCTIVLVTGPLWAKPAWGIWWTWDARLTSTLVLWLTYGAYLLLRRLILDEGRQAVLAAVVGILGFLDVPVVFFSIQWWRTQHPQPVLAAKGGGLEPQMWATLLVCWVAMTLLFGILLWLRVSCERLHDEIREARSESIG